jgi:Domain of unknown function (DUF4388)
MDEQGSTIDEAFGHPADPSADRSESGPEDTSSLTSASTSDPTEEGKEPSMNQHESSEEAPAASLVGSLAAFSLSDILSMLASTKQTGELQVVSESTDGKVWLADGELSNAQVGSAVTIGQAVFELACVSDGWFYFTLGIVSSSGQPTVPVMAVLNEVRPQVDEWREIRRDVPLEAVVTLAPEPPGQDVQIRSDQWRVLTTVGTSGHSVRDVLDQIGGDHIVGLRTLRDLRSAGLIEFDGGPALGDGASPGLTFESSVDRGADLASLPAPPDLTGSTVDDVELVSSSPPPPEGESPAEDAQRETLAEVAVMPPPIADDPWAPTVDTTAASDNGVA